MKTQERSQRAGIKLWEIAGEYKQYRAELTDKTAFRLALLANPDLAESYLGCPVRRDCVNEVIKFLHGGAPLRFSDV